VGTQNSLVCAVVYGLLVSGLAGAVLPVSAQQPANPEKNVEVANLVEPGRTSLTELAAEQAKVDGLPDSPGANLAKQKSEGAGFATLMVAQNQASQSQSTQPQSSQTSSSSTQPNQNSAPDAQKPVGTAAAEAPHTTGVAASQPAGVAIAPAKQHRVRTIVIRVGAIVGAGVAVGTVIALTEGTSSKPPGAH
jgi:hypothetical protein